MTDYDSTIQRRQLQAELFPDGIPTLWCPPLTHYTRDGALDRARIVAHWWFMSPWVKGLLVPGTTGDGWELTAEETRELISIALVEARRLNLHLLLGALHPEAEQALRMVEEGVALLKTQTRIDDSRAALRGAAICGFAACPPRGKRVSQPQMEKALARLLESGLPFALYQLPQVTQNEMSPELVASLTRRFPNFVLFKDTSGGDQVASSGLDFGGLFLVRGMEGDYARWLRLGGGCYDGFLLSAANSFCGQLHQIREFLAAERKDEAKALSERLTQVIRELFDIVDGVAGGNKFANANKLADHYYAHGPKAAKAPPPRLHSGWGLTQGMVRATGESLARHGFMPAKGYLE